MTAIDTTVLPRGHRRAERRRIRRIVLGCGLALLLVIVGVLGWFFAEAYPIGGSGSPTVFYVGDGEPFSSIANTLAAKGIVSSALAFRLDVMVQGTPNVDPGWYEAPTSSSFSAVRALLSNGPNAMPLITTTGESALEIAQGASDLESQVFAGAFLRDVIKGGPVSAFQGPGHHDLEGLIAPGTYVLYPGETATTLLTQMVQRFTARAASVGLTPTTRFRGLDAYQLVTVASIVEKEGYYAVNMPKTATVIYNRLARGMPLQMDSTVEYALGQDGGPVTHATESVPSPYNTYLHVGLTPTPICIPSTQALSATLHPPSGSWLYFTLVSQSGQMAFSTTFAQQLRNEELAASRGL
jgi:UPF0755 protein